MNKSRKHPQMSLDWEKVLDNNGYRITHPRRVIMDLISTSERPLTPLEIFDQARMDAPEVGLMTVYRTIEKLVELKLVDHVHQSDNCQTIFRATQNHQHLLICTECGNSIYFEGLEVEDQFKNIGKSLGYQVTHHWLQLEGLCQNCQNRS